MFRSRRTSRFLVLLLLLAADAAAGSRISLLPFEGDRPRPLRWRVASALKRSGHVVLGYAPPANRSSAASLRSYAERRNVDLYVTGTSEDTPQGWVLSLRVRGPDGKAVGQTLRFQADNLPGLIKELKSEGPSKLDRAVRVGAPSGSYSATAELPPGRALPLPTRRARPARPRSDRPVLPGETPAEAVSADEVAREEAPAAAPRARKELDLDAAVAASVAAQSWDADADAPASKPSARARAQAKQDPAAARAAKRRAAQQRLALGGLALPLSKSSGEIDLDADTRSALEEAPARKAPPPIDEPEPESSGAAESMDDPVAEPAREAESAAAEAEPEAAREVELDDPAPRAKPKKKGSLFAGSLSRKPKPQASEPEASPAEDPVAEESSETSVEDRTSRLEAQPAPRGVPHAVLSARAGYMHRSMEYSSDIYNRLRAPTTNTWMYRFDAGFYPFARPLKERFSIIGSYEGSLGGSVYDQRSDSNFGVGFSQWAAGLRFRQPLGDHELGIQATFGNLTSGLDESSGVTGVPEISYLLLSPSVDAALNFGAFSVRSSLAYQRPVGGFGEISSSEWFPHMQGYGFEGQLGLDYRLSPSVALQGSGTWRRFVLDMNSRPEDAVGGKAEVAGGAVDQYLSGYFGVRFTL